MMLNEGLVAFFQANGATSDDLQDAEYEFLIARGTTPAATQDMWMEYLSGKGYTGSRDDMRLAWWAAGAPI